MNQSHVVETTRTRAFEETQAEREIEKKCQEIPSKRNKRRSASDAQQLLDLIDQLL